MANTYSQIYLQIVISVNGRQNLLHKSWRKKLFTYMAGIVNSKNHKCITINGVADHVHLFIGLIPSEAISDLVRDVKNNSSNFINDNKLVNGKFSWQAGYGVFSYSQSNISNVFQYISNQEEHHKSISFKDEYVKFLNEYQISYQDKYLFEMYDID